MNHTFDRAKYIVSIHIEVNNGFVDQDIYFYFISTPFRSLDIFSDFVIIIIEY